MGAGNGTWLGLLQEQSMILTVFFRLQDRILNSAFLVLNEGIEIPRSKKNPSEKELLQGSDGPHNPSQICFQRAYQLYGMGQVLNKHERKDSMHAELQNTQCFRLKQQMCLI